MEHVTIGRKHNAGKVAFVKCVKNGSLDNINIKGKCFLLIILSQGKLEFRVGRENIVATAPSFLCFDELENPLLVSKSKARYTCVYFQPKFLNVNMTFELLRSNKYNDIATTHDMFMLKPFVDKAYVVPIAQIQVEKIKNSADYMLEELTQQRDWYWSCRARSYFTEIIITLERMYGLIGYGVMHQKSDTAAIINNPRLRDAVLYIETHYGDTITLSDISAGVGVNHTTLTALMKEELGCTAIEYLTKYRITVSKKQLAFTNVPIKDVADMVGFKTVQHFNRIFKETTGTTPAEFRKAAVAKRKNESLVSGSLEDRRNALELMWQETLKKFGDNPGKSLQISIKALEEFPYDKIFLFRAAIAEEWLADRETNDTSKQKHLNNAMGYARCLLKEEPQNEAAKELMVKIYSKLGSEDLAVKQALKCENTDLALKFCLTGDNLRRHRQQIIDKKLHELLYEMSIQDLNMLDMCEQIVNIVIPDANYQYYYHILAGIYLKRANIFLQKGDQKAAVDCLRKLFEISKNTADRSGKTRCFTALLFDLLESDVSSRERLGYVEYFLFAVKREFQGLESNDEFKKILEEASACAGEHSISAVEDGKDKMC